jgi:hypothetical protein
MKYKLLITAMTISFCLLSCNEISNTSSDEGGISIIGTLQTKSDKQYLKIYHLVNLLENNKYDTITVKAAEVKLIGDNFSESMLYSKIFYESVESGEYCYMTTNPMINKILPGKTYRLYVKNGDKVIEGTTTLPGDFHFTSHKNNDTINPYEKFSLRWSKSENSSIYIIQYYCRYKVIYSGNINYYSQFEQVITQDTSLKADYFTTVKSNNPQYTLTLLYGYVRIIAFDKNYYDHTYLMRDRVGLDNGLGCFSSGVVDTLRLYFKK